MRSWGFPKWSNFSRERRGERKGEERRDNSDCHPPIWTVGQPLTILFGGPSASTTVSPIRQAGSPFITTVALPSITTPGPCGGMGKGVEQA